MASKDLAQDFWVVRKVSGAGAGAGWLGQSPAPTPSFLEILTGLRQSAALYI